MRLHPWRHAADWKAMAALGALLVARPKRVVAATAALFGAYLLLVTFHLGGQQHALGNVFQCVAALSAAVVCLCTASQHEKRLRLSWRLLGLSAGSWGIGQTIWTYYELVAQQDVPFPSFADLGYLLAVPIGVAALATFIDTPSGRVAWMRAALEGGVIAAGILFVGWTVALGPVYRSGGDTLLTQAISLAYPMGDIVIASLVLYAACRSRAGARTTLILVGIGMVLLACADSGFAALTVRGTYETGAFTDLGWFGGYLCIGLASLRIHASDEDGESAITSRLTQVTAYIPFIPFALGMLLVLTGVADLRGDSMLYWSGIATVVMVGGMQITAIVDNGRLQSHLEARVAERTRDLHHRESFFRAIVQNSSDVVTVVDKNLVILYQTPSGPTMLGRDPRTLAGISVLELFDESERERVETMIDKVLRESSQTVMLEVTSALGRHSHQVLEVSITNLLGDENVEGIVVTTTDVTERKALEEQLTHQAFHDSLTTLPNRALFHDRLTHALARYERKPEHPLAVLFIDLDSFKSVNDSLGHAAGDELLYSFAKRVQSFLRPGDTFSRLGGDEFAVLIEECFDVREAIAVAERISKHLLKPFTVGGREIFVNASIGITTNEFASSAEEIQRNADVAMYNAKAAGRGGFRVYEPQMHDAAMARLEMESGLRRALERREFVLHYQPLVDFKTDRIVGVEALVRWQDPEKGLIPPDQFIPIAEQTGLILPIGRWVLKQACADAAGWYRLFGESAPRVSVNLSYRQLQHPDLVDDLAMTLFDCGLPAQRLLLELTESMLADDPAEAARKLHAVKELGIKLAIDDFGTGYSSLSYLRQFPFDELKIDRKFVASLTSESDDTALVQAILDLSRSFELSTVAEGIETAEQSRRLREMGCEMGQGYFFSRPMPAEQMSYVLDSRDIMAPTPLALGPVKTADN